MRASIAAPRTDSRAEPASPFIAWSDDDRAPIADLDLGPASLIDDLLRSPQATAERVLDPSESPELVLGALGTIVAGTACFGAIVAAARPGGSPLVTAAFAVFDVLLALAAALGPIYAASILAAARLPLSRLVATLLSSAAVGSLLLAALAPLPYGLWKVDDTWAGPLALVGAFAVSAIASGSRMRRLLHALAEQVDPETKPTERDRARVAIVARMSMVFVAFTTGLSLWAFDAFV